MIYSRILGTGSQLPPRVVTNHDLEEIMDTSDQWIRERTGIRERRIVADGVSAVQSVPSGRMVLRTGSSSGGAFVRLSRRAEQSAAFSALAAAAGRPGSRVRRGEVITRAV